MIREKDNTPSVMRFAKDLDYFSKDPRTHLRNIRKIRIVSYSETPGPLGPLAALAAEAVLKDGDTLKFLMSGTYVFYALNAGGKLRQTARTMR